MRQPKQRRATQRRESILDAAAELLATVGYEGVSTNALARQAGASIGTVYQYFPNKQAVLEALLERYRVRLAEALLPPLSQPAEVEAEAVLAAVIRAFADFYIEEPGYAQLWLGTQLVGPLREAGAAWGSSFAELFGAALQARGAVEPARAELVATVLVHAVSAVVSAAVSDPSRRDELVDEAVRLGQAYLRAG